VPLILAASTAAVGQDSNNSAVSKPAPEVQRIRVSSGFAVKLLIKESRVEPPLSGRGTTVRHSGAGFAEGGNQQRWRDSELAVD
jgi:hypothetical protein